MKKILYTYMLVVFVFNLNSQVNFTNNCSSTSGWTRGGSWGNSSTTLGSCTSTNATLRANLWSSASSLSLSRNAGTSLGGQMTVNVDFTVIAYSGGGASPSSYFTLKFQKSTDGSTWTDVQTLPHTPSTTCQTATFTYTPAAGNTYFKLVYTWLTTGDMWAHINNVSIVETVGPAISVSGSLSAFAGCNGGNSSEQSFSVSGSSLTNDITITPPTGYEISTTSGGGFTSSIVLSETAGSVGSTTIYVRTKTSATSGDGGNITFTSTGATTQNVATGSATLSSNVYYVSTTGSDANDGFTSGTPFATIQHAIDNLNTSCGDAIVYVADGTYDESNIDIDVSVTIIGDSESGTIIDNNDVSGEYCFTVTTDNVDVQLKNLTIRDFTGDAGCAFRSYRHDNKVIFDAVTVNSCYILSSATYDGAVFIFHDTGATGSDSVVVKNCTFSDNYSAQADYATALFVGSYDYDYDYPVLITNCVFDNNDSDGSVYSYGAVNIDRGYSAEVTECIFKNNTGHGYNSGLKLGHIGSAGGTAGRSIVENCLFHDNSLSFAGAAMGFDNAIGTITNCTFAQNSNTNVNAYYVSNIDVSSSTIAAKNCIFQSDDSGNEMISGGTISYSTIFGGSGGDTYTNGGNNLSSDPLFTNSGTNDFTLSSSSPAIDAGTATGAPTDDLLGSSRGGSPDMGCYEAASNDWTGAVSTAWLTTGNWSLGSVPGVSDSPTIPNVTNQPVITSAVTIAGLTIDSGADITITSNSLTVTGAIDINGTMNIDNATVNADGTFDATSGAIDFTNASGSLVLSSTVTNLGTLDAAMGSVTYDGATQTVLADSYYNLNISTAGTKTAGGNIDVDGDLTTAATATCKLDLGAFDLTLAGDLTVGATDGLDASDASCLVTIDGSSDQSITHAGTTGGTNTVTLVSEYFSGFSTGFLTETVSTTSTYQDVNNCTTEAGEWEIATTNQSHGGTHATMSGNRAVIEYVGSSCVQDNYIITKQFSPSTTSLNVSFKYCIKGWTGQIVKMYLYNETDAAIVETYVDAGPSDLSNQNYSTTTTLSGGNSTSDTYTFRVQYTGTYDYGAAIDDILITEEVSRSGAEFTEFTINKASGDIILSSEINVDGTLTFTSGDIDATTNNLVFTANGTTTGASDASHVNGTIVKTTESTTAFTFPIGDGTTYRPIGITPDGASSTEWTVSYSASAHGDTDVDGSGLDHVSTQEFWNLNRTGAANASISLTWSAANGITDYTELTIAHYDGTTDWDMIAATPSGNNTSGTINSDAAVTTFSPFTIGSTGTANPLPVELVTFYGVKENEVNNLKWTTASEKNSDYFMIEKTTDGVNFESIGQIIGAGNSVYYNSYTLADQNVDNILNYYRLVQVDFDGVKTYSNLISIDNRSDSNKEKTLLQITNTWGQEVNDDYIGVVIYIYSDGSIERVFKN